MIMGSKVKRWMPRFSLTAKFNAILVVVFSIAFAFTAVLTDVALKRKAHQEALDRANLMMETAMAIRSYTVAEVRPLLGLQMKQTFLPQSVPAYAAIKTIEKVSETRPAYNYREASTNPTNPRNRAVDWETDVINYFRRNPQQTSVAGVRQTLMGASLYLARPIVLTTPSCLVCHSSPEIAPEPLLIQYGTGNGFGWKLNDVFGAQVMSVDAAIPFQQARRTFYVFMGSILGVFVFIMIVLNILLRYAIVLPVVRLSQLADEVSKGRMDMPEFSFETYGGEIDMLSASFNRMRRSLSKAMDLIEK